MTLVTLLKTLENSIKLGYKNNLWYPHKSLEGGLDTIGYGHKITPLELSRGLLINNKRYDAYQGLPEELIEILLLQDIHRSRVLLETRVSGFPELSDSYQSILICIDFNTGNVSDKRWPKLLKAMREDDLGGIRNEMVTSYRRLDGVRVWLDSRADLVYNNLISPGTPKLF